MPHSVNHTTACNRNNWPWILKESQVHIPSSCARPLHFSRFREGFWYSTMKLRCIILFKCRGKTRLKVSTEGERDASSPVLEILFFSRKTTLISLSLSIKNMHRAQRAVQHRREANNARPRCLACSNVIRPDRRFSHSCALESHPKDVLFLDSLCIARPHSFPYGLLPTATAAFLRRGSVEL